MTTREGGSNSGYTALIIAITFKSHLLFESRALGLSLLQPKQEIEHISASSITAAVTQFTLFLSLSPIPNILRASSP